MKQFISWRRVSTKRQGKSGLGMAAQSEIIAGHVALESGEIIADYEEVYTGTHLELCSELRKAIDHCKHTGATLIIAKTDRFRNAAEALGIYEELDGNVYFCDAPSQDKMILTIMFAIYEREALNISIRTKAALDAKKKRDGSWTHLYGKNTGTTRKESAEKANEASCRSKQDTARCNANNERFYRYILNYESKNGRIDRLTDIEAIVRELNALGFKTATGMTFDCNRFRSMHKKVRMLYSMD